MSNLSRKEQDNRLRWDGRQRGHYEVYYLKWNDLKSRTAGWIRYTLTVPLPQVCDPYCELWGMHFDSAEPKNSFAVKNRFPIQSLRWDKDRFLVQIESAELRQNSCRAAVSNPDKNLALSWDLTFDSPGPTLYYFPGDFFYGKYGPKTKSLVPHLDARFQGSIVANGRKIQLDQVPGLQNHLWGTEHAWRWAWGHCNTFSEDPAVVFDAVDSQIMLGPWVSPHMKFFYLKFQGREYCLNHPRHWALYHQSQWELGRWTFLARFPDLRVRGEIWSPFEQMLGVTYMEPDGRFLWCNNNTAGAIKLAITDRSGKSLAELTSDGGCTVEFVDRKIYPQVPIRL